MPASTIADLFRPSSFAPLDARRQVPDDPPLQRGRPSGPDSDFAGVLAENIDPRPAPEPNEPPPKPTRPADRKPENAKPAAGEESPRVPTDKKSAAPEDAASRVTSEPDRPATENASAEVGKVSKPNQSGTTELQTKAHPENGLPVARFQPIPLQQIVTSVQGSNSGAVASNAGAESAAVAADRADPPNGMVTAEPIRSQPQAPSNPTTAVAATDSVSITQRLTVDTPVARPLPNAAGATVQAENQNTESAQPPDRPTGAIPQGGASTRTPSDSENAANSNRDDTTSTAPMVFAQHQRAKSSNGDALRAEQVGKEMENVKSSESATSARPAAEARPSTSSHSVLTRFGLAVPQDIAVFATKTGTQVTGSEAPAEQGPLIANSPAIAPTASSGAASAPTSASIETLTGKPGAAGPAAESAESGSPSPVEQVVRAVRVQIGARESQVRLLLDPPELGPVRIDVRVVGNNLQLHVQTQTLVAHQLLNARVGELQQALESQGLNIERVQFELREPSPTAQSHDRQEQTGTLAQDTGPDARSRGHDPTEQENATERSEQPADLLGADAQTEGADEKTVATESRVNVWA